MLTSAHRRVRHLRIRAPTSEDARALVPGFEDALRTASLPSATESELILIRRVDIGVLDRNYSGPRIALSLEAALRSVAATAVWADSSSAATADAVRFADVSEAMVAAARIVAAGQPLDAWFWPQALPGLRSVGSGETALWQLLMSLATTAPAPVLTAARVTAVACRSSRSTSFLKALSSDAAQRWLRTLGPWDPVDARDASKVVSAESASSLLAGQEPWLRRLGSDRDDGGVCDDPCAVWMVASMAIDSKPKRIADPRLPMRAAAAVAQLESSFAMGRRGIPRSTPSAGKVAPGAVDDSAPVVGDKVSGIDRGQARSEPVRAADSNLARLAGPDREPIPAADIDAPAGSPKDLKLAMTPTVLGGLFFLVPVLHRLGWLDFVSQNPELIERGFSEGLLSDIADRCLIERKGFERGDPLIAECLGSSETWRSDARLGEWRREVRRACRVRYGIGLASLVVRPAGFRCTATHLVVELPVHQIDLRIRRAALDVDPGWVPWLGRVVQFHYRDTYAGG